MKKRVWYTPQPNKGGSKNEKFKRNYFSKDLFPKNNKMLFLGNSNIII